MDHAKVAILENENPMNKAIFTVCSRNYLGQAATLMTSVREHAPDAARFIVVVDRRVEAADIDPSLATIIWIDELGIQDLEYRAFVFDVLELNTNVKPSALKYLLLSFDQCLYLDPDIVLYAPLRAVWDGLQAANVVVTPHLLDPQSTLTFKAQQDLLRNGGFNLGFIGVTRSAETLRFLDWWEICCLEWGFHAPSEGFFVDQKFMDHGPVLFEGFKVLRQKGLNVAYWNLHERPVQLRNGIWMVGDEPLVFMHYSGFIFEPKGEEVDLISKYPAVTNLAIRPELRALFDDYRHRLASNGYPDLIRIDYSFSVFDDGMPIPRLARRLIGSGAIPVTSRVRPFRAEGEIYRRLRGAGALPPASPGAAPQPARRRDRGREHRQLDTGLRVLRWLYRRLGVNRYDALVKFMGFASGTLNQRFLLPPALGDRDRP
jgi:hypothetical protein